MARYSGRYYRGASRDVRERKRIEAETRDTKRYRNGGYIDYNVDGPHVPPEQAREDVRLALTGINGYPLRNA